MNDLLDLVRSDLLTLVWWSLPLVVGAAGAAVGVGWLAARLGLANDPVPVMVARWAAVFGVVWVFGGVIVEELTTITREHWEGLADVGAPD